MAKAWAGSCACVFSPDWQSRCPGSSGWPGCDSTECGEKSSTPNRARAVAKGYYGSRSGLSVDRSKPGAVRNSTAVL